MHYVFSLAQNIALYLILTSFVSIITPQKKFKQYIDLCLGVIFIFIVLSPLTGFINAISGSDNMFSDISLRYNQHLLQNQIYEANSEHIGRIMTNFEVGLLEQLHRIVDAHGEFTVLQAQFFISDNIEAFGQLLGLQMAVSNIESTARTPFITIEPIRIAPNVNTRGQRPELNEDIETSQILSLKSIISDFYNLDKQNIIIEIQG